MQAKGERIQRHPLPVPLVHCRQHLESGRLHHCRGREAVMLRSARLALFLLAAALAAGLALAEDRIWIQE